MTKATVVDEAAKLTYSVAEAAQILGVGRTFVFDLIAEGKLRSLKLGRRRLIARTDLEAFVEELKRAA